MVHHIAPPSLRLSPEKKERLNLIQDLWKRLTSPKTHYTYSISPSYSCESLIYLFDEEDYSIPIMSRQNLRHRVNDETERVSEKNLKSVHGSRKVFHEEHSVITRASFYQTPNYNQHVTSASNIRGNEITARNLSNLYGLDLSDEDDSSHHNRRHRSHHNYIYLFINYIVTILRSIIHIILLKIYSFKNVLIRAIYQLYNFTNHFMPFKNQASHHLNHTRGFIRPQSLQNEQELQTEDEPEESDNIGRGVRRSTRNINKSSAHEAGSKNKIGGESIVRRHQHSHHQTRGSNLPHLSGQGASGLGGFIHSKADYIKNSACNLIHNTSNKLSSGYQKYLSPSRHGDHYYDRNRGSIHGDDEDVRRTHPTSHHYRRHGRHHGLFTLCSLPCLLLLLLPLILGLYLRRGQVDDYMVHNQRLKDYYQPLKSGIHTINEKVLENVPDVRNMTATGYHNIIGWVSNLTSSPKWDPSSDLRMVLGRDDPKNLKEKEPNSQSHALTDGLKSAYQTLKNDYELLKDRISNLEIVGGGSKDKPHDPDWWKGEGAGEGTISHLKVLVEETVGKEIGDLKEKLGSLSSRLLGRDGKDDLKSEKGDSSWAEIRAEVAQLSNVLDGLRHKYDALSSKSEAQEKELESAKLSLGRISNDKSLQNLLTRTDTLTAQVESIHKALEKSKIDTEKLSKFAKECCKRDVVYNKDGTLGESDIANLLLKLKVSDMDAQTKDKFFGLLKQHFASHSRLDELKNSLHLNITKMGKDLSELKQSLIREIKDKIPFQSSAPQTGDGAKGSCIEEQRVRKIIEEMLDLYSADQTGMPDYALESGGGSIFSTRCSETYDAHAALVKFLGIPLWFKTNSPRIAIQPGTQPGQCWAFKGSAGYLVVKLAATIRPTAFSIDHIPKSLSPSGTIDSAPKDFSIWALQDENDITGTMLGRYRYDKDGKSLQLFITQQPDPGFFRYIELKIESNWGNPDYTCLYRFRVHGTPLEHHEHH